jgi:hypothetical protein
LMKNENIVTMLERLVAEADALSEGKSTVEIEEDPRLCALTLQLESIVEELDQIVTTAFPNHPEKVGIWKKAMGIGSDDDEIE